ncbi:MAG: hypothetical protein WBX15_05020 [Thermoanaerobaculia bacterium]
MDEPKPPGSSPTGRVDTIDVSDKKLTVQTEFFHRPAWRAETKVYLGGALKKVYQGDLSGVDEAELQHALMAFHETKLREIVDGLRNLKR